MASDWVHPSSIQSVSAGPTTKGSTSSNAVTGPGETQGTNSLVSASVTTGFGGSAAQMTNTNKELARDTKGTVRRTFSRFDI